MDDGARLAPLFGANIDPGVANIDEAFARARLADEHGLDLVAVQDHPYNPDFLDTWTLLAALGASTQRVHVGANVLSTPLHPPAMLAKAAASLDVLTGGRVELGLGAGASPEGIAALGGPRLVDPGERFRAFRESIEVIRGLWASGGQPFTFVGEFHQIDGATFGPSPAHPIRIWTGVLGPRALRLTGAVADGLLISSSYVPTDQLPEINRLVDEGAAAAGRAPSAIRRGYNLMGVLETGTGEGRVRSRRPGMIVGPAGRWVDEIVRFYEDYRQDTFTFWPVAGDERAQIERFAREVAPAVRARLTHPGQA